MITKSLLEDHLATLHLHHSDTVLIHSSMKGCSSQKLVEGVLKWCSFKKWRNRPGCDFCLYQNVRTFPGARGRSYLLLGTAPERCFEWTE